MPHDHDDHDAAGFGLREHIDEASSVNASGGYSIPSTPFIIAPYRSLAVFVKPNGGGAFSVSVTWDQDGIAGGATATETKASTLTDGETLIFRNQGVQITDVTITASADTAYAVMPSDVDPLAPSADTVYPSHQHISIPGWFEFGYGGSGSTSLVIDALCFHNYYVQLDGQNHFLSFMFLAGPRYARHEVIFTGLQGPNFGIQKYELASLTADVQADQGYAISSELIQNVISGSPAPVFVDMGGAVDQYRAAVARNVTWGINFRVTGAKGDPLTTIALDPDFFPAGDGGPGLYMMRVTMASKNALSSAYRAAFSEIGVHRIGDSGFL